MNCLNNNAAKSGSLCGKCTVLSLDAMRETLAPRAYDDMPLFTLPMVGADAFSLQRALTASL
jgi:hypothetical protein